ncbi:RE1 [Symbiodinium sp. CCMP2592]|nr:RE1 [Symbiodinium sp. CCMP2592]
MFNLAENDDADEEESDLPDLEDNEGGSAIQGCGGVPVVTGTSSTGTASGDGAVYGAEAWSTTGWTSRLTEKRPTDEASGTTFLLGLLLLDYLLLRLQARPRRAAHQALLQEVCWAAAADGGDDELEPDHLEETTEPRRLQGEHVDTILSYLKVREPLCAQNYLNHDEPIRYPILRKNIPPMTRMGPEKGVKFRGGAPPQPPLWKYESHDLRAFAKWSRKVEIWQVQVAHYMTSKEAALLLYTSLTGEAEAEMEHVKFLADYEQISRYPGEGLRSFSNRYRRIERSLEALGVSICGMHDSESRGNRLLERARLSAADQRLIMVGASYNLEFEAITESMTMQYPEFRAAPPVVTKDGTPLIRTKGKGNHNNGPVGKGTPAGKGQHQPQRVYITEEHLEQIPENEEQPAEADADEDNEEQAEDDAAGDDDGDANEAEDLAKVAEVLTVTAKKLAGLKLGDPECPMAGQGAGTRSSPSAPAAAGVKGPAGHATRPPATGAPKGDGKGKKAPHQTFFVRDFGSFEAAQVDDQPEYGTAFSVNVVFEVRDAPTGTDRFGKVMILDTACQRTCCGLEWEAQHTLDLVPHGLQTHHVDVTDAFQFGSGPPLVAKGRSYVPAGIGGASLIFGAGVLDAKIPLLASNKLLESLGMILDMPSSQVSFVSLGVAVPMLRIDGHIAVRIDEFADCPEWHTMQSSIDWCDPPPELAARGELVDGARVVKKVMDLRRHLFTSMGCAVNLGILDPEIYQAVPPILDVRFVQEVPHETEMERPPGDVGRPPRHKVRNLAANLATAIALLVHYCTGGFQPEQQPVRAFSPGVPEFGYTQAIELEAPLPKAAAGSQQRIRDGAGPVAAGSRGRVGELRLDRGTLKRLKGGWARSARFLENEREIYDVLPATVSRPPPAIDVLCVFRGSDWLHGGLASYRMTSTALPLHVARRLRDDPEVLGEALRALRRLRPHVLYVSCLDFFPGDNKGPYVQHLIEEQAQQGRTYILADSCDAAAVQTTIPGGSSFLLDRSPATQENLHDGIVELIRDYVATKEPMRFGIYQALVTYREPVRDLTAWDTIAEMMSRSFGSEGSRPFYIDPGSEVGKEVQNLLRITAVRIQCVQRPTQRRLPQDVPYTARAAFLIHSDNTRAVEVENLALVQHPKQRFAKPVRHALLAYGNLIEETETPAETPITDLPTDISFPNLSQQVPLEVRRAIAKAHINLGHASPQEMLRLAVQTGNPSEMFLQTIRRLNCATCARLKGPQPPPPASTTVTASQFGDRVEIDIFYLRDLTGKSCMVLGAVDVATRFHQAAVLETRNPEEAYRALEMMWLRPFGLMVQLGADPDGTFQGTFEERLRSHGVLIDFCPADAHYKIAHVERQNAFLRTILEKLVDTFAATNVKDIELLIAPALHAANSLILTRGRSAYQAVFGSAPRLPGGLFSDSNALATTPTTDAAATAEIVRAEAIKTIADLNVKQSLRRALLRKTRHVTAPDLQPGQPCSFWRWRKKGVKKRGGWLSAKFLSWDPSAPGKLAWVRSGTATALVAIEQLRAATGYEAWIPDEAEVKALKDAARTLDDSLWSDETGPPPPKRSLEQDDVEMDPELGYDISLPEVAAAVASSSSLAAPPPAASAGSGAQPVVNTQVQSTLVYQPQVQNTVVHNTARLGDPAQGSRRGMSTPRTPRARSAPRTPRAIRSRSPKPSALAAQPANRSEPQELQPLPSELPEPPVQLPSLDGNLEHQELQPLPSELLEPPVPVPQTPLEVGLESAAYSSAPFEDSNSDQHMEEPETPVMPMTVTVERPTGQQQPGQVQAASASAASSPRPSTTPVTSEAPSGGPDPLPPAKRPFETLSTLFFEDGYLQHCEPGDTLEQSFGPQTDLYYQTYLASNHRKDDLKGSPNKPANESDSSDTDRNDEARPNDPAKDLTRAEAKALDREIPWRKILEMDKKTVEAFKAATEKEAKSWQDWGSVKPLSHEQARKVLQDKILARRVLRTRSCFRDKSRGIGELIPKCRVVALGHKDPDIYRINRECATPNRTSEHVLFCVLTSGSNREFAQSGKEWFGWTGDASTAFLQGDIQNDEREQPLYLLPPNDGITSLTSCWKAPLYLVCTNIYGLSNAPRLWSLTVIARLVSLGYRQHSFDKMVFMKFGPDGHLISLIIVYVDDFLGTYREDYDVTEVHKAFKWGALHDFKLNEALTFKGKQLTLKENAAGRIYLHVCQRDFLDSMSAGRVPKGADLTSFLTADQKAEFRSVAGSLQWLSGQTRPELAAVNSLSNHGAETTVGDLKTLFEALDFAKETRDDGFIIADVPLDRSTAILVYTDASWANAEKCRSQCGVLVVLCAPTVLEKTTPAMIVDWRSSRSTRVCRSTLAAEASAADEGCDRAVYVSLFLGELLYNVPAHKVGQRFLQLSATDAKSLYDCVVSDSPNLSDKRSLVNVRAIQEVVSGNRFHWIPTDLMWADGLTKISHDLQASFHLWLQDPTATLKK